MNKTIRNIPPRASLISLAADLVNAFDEGRFVRDGTPREVFVPRDVIPFVMDELAKRQKPANARVLVLVPATPDKPYRQPYFPAVAAERK